MTTVLICALIITIGIIVYQKITLNKKLVKLKKEFECLREELEILKQEKIPEKDIQFLEFAVDMYIKYAKDLDIHSEEQHEYIVGELERIRKKYLNYGDI